MEVLKFLLKTRDQIQLYHWNTKYYSRHKLSDDLYNSLNELIDRFVEAYMSKYEMIHPKKMKLIKLSDDDFIDYLVYIRDKLREIPLKENDNDLQHILDEFHEEISKSIYLSRQI